MNEKRFKKLIQEYPFLIDDTYQISLTEAKKIHAEGFPSGQEIIAGAKAKYKDLPTEAWKVYDDALAAQAVQKGKTEIPIRTTSKAQRFAHRHSRLIAACIIVALLLSFFTLVPAGRALAAEIIRFFAEVFGNRIEITIEGQNYSGQSEDIFIEAKTHAELGDIGIEPFVLKEDFLTVETVAFEAHSEGKTIFTTYVAAGGAKVYTTQQWDISGDYGFMANIEDYQSIPLQGERIIYISTDIIDSALDGILIRNIDLIVISTKEKNLFYKIIDNL